MPTRILVLETPAFKPEADLGPEVARADSQAFPALVEQHQSAETQDSLFVLAHSECRTLPAVEKAVLGPNSISVFFFQAADDVARLSQHFVALAAENRSTGLKECLPKGSTIFSESFFNANSVGAKLDPCYRYARQHLSSAAAVNAWGCLQALVFFGLQNLPEQGEQGGGERVDVQIGGDASLLALTVRFDLPAHRLAATLASPLLRLPRTAAGLCESRYLQVGAKMELNCLFYGSGGPGNPVEAISFRKEPALENAETVKSFQFKPFSSLAAGEAEEKRVVKGGFRKKFSESVTTGKEGMKEPEQKIVVSGSGSIGKGSEATIVKGGTAAAATPGAALLESRIQGLESDLKQRNELIGKLNKEIEEIKDPLRRGVISGIKDNQVEGLKGNLTSIKADLEESQKREKELMAMVDKAMQIKDDSLKRIRELEIKMKQGQGGKNSQVAMLEKQLEEQKRQNKEMSKRVGSLVEQIKAAGLRPAA